MATEGGRATTRRISLVGRDVFAVHVFARLCLIQRGGVDKPAAQRSPHLLSTLLNKHGWHIQYLDCPLKGIFLVLKSVQPGYRGGFWSQQMVEGWIEIPG